MGKQAHGHRILTCSRIDLFCLDKNQLHTKIIKCITWTKYNDTSKICSWLMHPHITDSNRLSKLWKSSRRRSRMCGKLDFDWTASYFSSSVSTVQVMWLQDISLLTGLACDSIKFSLLTPTLWVGTWWREVTLIEVLINNAVYETYIIFNKNKIKIYHESNLHIIIYSYVSGFNSGHSMYCTQ
jgi:hypothetical protein